MNKTINTLLDELGGLVPALVEYVREEYPGEVQDLGGMDPEELTDRGRGLRYGLMAIVEAAGSGSVSREQADALIGFASGDPGYSVDHYPDELSLWRHEDGRLQVDRMEFAESRQAASGAILAPDGSWVDPALAARWQAEGRL